MSEIEDPGSRAVARFVTNDGGAVFRARRARNARTQGEGAVLLHTTQQHRSQMKTGIRLLMLELRRVMVAVCFRTRAFVRGVRRLAGRSRRAQLDDKR